jgi:hypothetical protein
MVPPSVCGFHWAIHFGRPPRVEGQCTPISPQNGAARNSAHDRDWHFFCAIVPALHTLERKTTQPKVAF